MKLHFDINDMTTTTTTMSNSIHSQHGSTPSNKPSVCYGTITGPIVMIGFGSVGRGTLPLIERHFSFDRRRMVVIDPDDCHRKLLDERGIGFVQCAVTRENYRDLLTTLLTDGGGQGFCVNLSVDTSSLDIMTLCRDLRVLYIDTVVEPWAGFYDNANAGPAGRSNYRLRETIVKAKQQNPGGTTAVSCCGANPGMVSWLVKEALLNVAVDLGLEFDEPTTRTEWARLMATVGVKGVHIAERDMQRSKTPKKMGVFVNTWSVDGFLSEGLQQPAELGWGTHETCLPDLGRRHETNKGAAASAVPAIYLLQAGAKTRVRSWCPTPGPQYGFLVTHNESISIADYFTVKDGIDEPNNGSRSTSSGGKVMYRPTCMYAYHPSDDTVLSLHELFGSGGATLPKQHHILESHEIVNGSVNELGVLLYGHQNNAYWYGSQLSIDQTRCLAPYQNATGLQVSSAVLAGMVWALENPLAGIVEADEMDHRRCLQVQRPYLGNVRGYYTDWTPTQGREQLFPDGDVDHSDPWQFRNMLVR
jgi:homospermidine synthase